MAHRLSHPKSQNMPQPILYSLRNCPYAMRARIALFKAKQNVEVREVVLSNKPTEMIEASPKGTVPTLVLANDSTHQTVIDESLDVMLWALNKNDPDNLLHRHTPASLPAMLALITRFDDEFKTRLNAYKCAKRYRENNVVECRQACEVYLSELETCLGTGNTRREFTTAADIVPSQRFIFGANESLADIALLPFIRQFSKVERQWYRQSPYPNVKQWLDHYLQSVMFNKVMTKYELWKPEQNVNEPH